jgi:NAD(P)-dependent dehydrogenase (short-subunit alcohol dehydrogenase family)
VSKDCCHIERLFIPLTRRDVLATGVNKYLANLDYFKMSSQLDGKVAIVTGSSAGLGEATAILLASRGASVTLCGRDQGRLQAVLDKVVKASGGHKDRVLTVQGDLTDHNVRKQIIDQTVAKYGRLDILVANAGVAGDMRPIWEVTEQSYKEVIDTNLTSVFFLIKEAVPHLEKTKGNIVNISSIASLMTNPTSSVYSMSKAALDHLTRCLAVELGQKGIRVNAINPGAFPTLIARRFGDFNEIIRQRVIAQNEQNALAGSIGVVEDIAEAVGFLVSHSAGFITGELITVDGGRHFTGPIIIRGAETTS